MLKKLAPLGIAAATLLAAGAAEGKTVTQPCTKDLVTGQYNYDSSKFSEDYIIKVVRFQESSRAGRTARGVCTINLKYQPAD